MSRDTIGLVPPDFGDPVPGPLPPLLLHRAALRVAAQLQSSQPCPLCDSTPHRPGAACAELLAALGVASTGEPEGRREHVPSDEWLVYPDESDDEGRES